MKGQTTCPYCGVGCGIDFTVDDNGDVTLNGAASHPANQGRLCVKGSSLDETLGTRNRLLHPQVDGLQASWEHALESVSQRLQQTINDHGPESVAFYVSGQLLTEDYYVANKFIKGFIGSANIDTNSRLCMSTAVAAHKKVFGSDTVPGCYEDLELADLLVITGSNMAWTHPVIYQRIAAAKKSRPDMRIVVIDPRRTMTAEIADLHLDLAGGSDAVLFEGLLTHLLTSDALDHNFIGQNTEGFAELFAQVSEKGQAIAEVARTCKLTEQQVHTFFELFTNTARTVTVFSQGINQSVNGVSQASTILHCHLVTGRIGKPGACPFSITGQPNAMGGREVGGLANQLAAHMDLENVEHRHIVGKFWGTDRIPHRAGLKAVDLFQAVAAGKIRFLWIMATNPVVSMPHADEVRKAIAACDCVVVSDCVSDSDTLRLADIKLPAAGWSEKDGTVTNSERCISRQRAFMPLSGEAKPDWWIICEVARRMGYQDQFAYNNAAAIFREHAALSGAGNSAESGNLNRDFDISALTHLSDKQYDALKPIQWPVLRDQQSNSIQGQARMFGNGFFYTPSQRARLFYSTYTKASAVSETWPILLNTGRIRDQWHTMTRTGESAKLLQHINEPFVDMHRDDMLALGVKARDPVLISSELGQCVVKAACNEGQSRGTAFMPIHWSDTFSSAARPGVLIAPVCDEFSGQPAFKQTAVRIEALPIRWHAILISRERLPLPDNLYWSQYQRAGWIVTRLAGSEPLTTSGLKQLWQQHNQAWAELDDVIQDDGSSDICLLAYTSNKPTIWFACENSEPEIDESWLLDAMDKNVLEALRLAAGFASGQVNLGPIVCSCHQVPEHGIAAAISSGCQDIEAIGQQTRAGTNCGSCIPELRRMLTRHAVTNSKTETEPVSEAIC